LKRHQQEATSSGPSGKQTPSPGLFGQRSASSESCQGWSCVSQITWTAMQHESIYLSRRYCTVVPWSWWNGVRRELRGYHFILEQKKKIRLLHEKTLFVGWEV